MDPLFFVHISALDQLTRIPLAFIDKHMKEETLTCVMLQDHKGGLFPVKIEEDYSFGEGWHEFARDHNLKVGHFLAFCYNDFMVFTVQVCNWTITSVLRDSPIDAQDAVTIDEEESTQPQNIPSSTDESLDKNEDNDSDYSDDSLHDGDDLVNEDEILVDDVLSFAGEMPFKCNTEDQKCCNIILPRSYAYGLNLGLPILFTRVNQLGRRSSANVILVEPVGKKFEGLRFYICSGRDVRIGRGWSKYSQAQGLWKGDNITVKIIENTMEVVKFQLSHNVPLNGLQSEKKSGTELKRDIVEHRSFRKLLNSPYSLSIPKAFVVRNSLARHRGNIVLQDGTGGSWNVSLHNYTNRTVMQGGWSKVVEANKLKLGDLIRFTLIEARPKPVMRFKVLRSADPKVKGQRSRFSTINNRL